MLRSMKIDLLATINSTEMRKIIAAMKTMEKPMRPLLTEDSQGNSESAYSFDGESSYIIVEDSDELDLRTQDVSISAWVRFSKAQPNEWEGRTIGAIAGKGFLSENAGYGLYVENGKIQFQIRQQSSDPYGYYYAETNDMLNDGSWHFIVGTIDRDDTSGIKLFVDGVLQDNKGNPTDLSAVDLSTSDSFTIGARGKYGWIELLFFRRNR